MLVLKGKKIGPTQFLKSKRVSSMWLAGKKIWGALSKYWRGKEVWRGNSKW